MKLFDYEGHLTAEGLKGLTDGTLDEMQRLEASEHLDFCDSCVERYALVLTDDVQITPPAELAPSVFDKIRSRLRAVFFSRFSRVAVAAVMTLVVWNGMFLGDGLLSRSSQWIEDYSKSRIELSQTAKQPDGRFGDFWNGLGQWFRQSFSMKPDFGK